jgi:hypothetical protein
MFISCRQNPYIISEWAYSGNRKRRVINGDLKESFEQTMSKDCPKTTQRPMTKIWNTDRTEKDPRIAQVLSTFPRYFL